MLKYKKMIAHCSVLSKLFVKIDQDYLIIKLFFRFRRKGRGVV